MLIKLLAHSVLTIFSILAKYPDVLCCRHPDFLLVRGTTICYASLTHVSGFVPGILGLTHGFIVHIMERFNIETFLDLVDHNEVCRLQYQSPMLRVTRVS